MSIVEPVSSNKEDLQSIIKAYLANSNFQQERQRLRASRDASIPALREVTQRFIAKQTDMTTFRGQLERTLRNGEDWGATGFGFMMELNKFGKYHLDTTTAPEEEFRAILTGLNAQTLGPRIEHFYKFLLEERERLRREGKSGGTMVAANRSAFILSLFAFWLDPEGDPPIYYDSLRKGLFVLVEDGFISTAMPLSKGPNALEVRTEADHLACVDLIRQLATRAPQLRTSRYWVEYFCYWLTKKDQPATAHQDRLFKDSDPNESFLSNTPTKPVLVQEHIGPYDHGTASNRGPAQPPMPFLENEPLRPTPEPLLTQLIHEAQRHILLDEEVIRRIYHALLAGHVILTGPPGTGKTELARILPELLWKSVVKDGSSQGDEADEETTQLTSETAYSTRLVTATDDWSPRTLISGITPQSINGTVSYKVQYGHLTSAILKNWYFQGDNPEEWSSITLHRTALNAVSFLERNTQRTFRGHWLVIDEFNRAPIDLALGDALTALGGSEALRIAVEGSSAELPIPQDFRIIGTLNSFDRNYLNQISEALKRRFSFVEILPPGRSLRAAEQSIVLNKALRRVQHLMEKDTLELQADSLHWVDEVAITTADNGQLALHWDEEDVHAFRSAFEAAWRLFEVIRIYRQLGTAQAISLIRHMLIAGLLQNYSTSEQWIGKALDAALCDTIADQLQVLLPDEIETLLLYLSSDHAVFSDAYNKLLGRLTSTPQRLYGQLLSLNSVSDEQEQPVLSEHEIEQIMEQTLPTVSPAVLTRLFQLEQPRYNLPQFSRRLRMFKAERGL